MKNINAEKRKSVRVIFLMTKLMDGFHFHNILWNKKSYKNILVYKTFIFENQCVFGSLM